MPRGRPRDPNLSDEEREKFIDLIRRGFGRQMALHNLGIPWHRYCRTAREVRGFKRSIQRAERFRDEQLAALHYSEAIGGNLDCQRYLMNRSDRAKEFVATTKLRRAELKAKKHTADVSIGDILDRGEKLASERAGRSVGEASD